MYGGQRRGDLLRCTEAEVQLNPHFPAYDGLRIASDKDLGKLFL